MLNLINSGQSWRNMIDQGVQGKCNKRENFTQPVRLESFGHFFVFGEKGCSFFSGIQNTYFT